MRDVLGNTYSKGTGKVARHCPAPASVKTEALVLDELEDTSTAESFWVCLTLDLEDVKG